MAPATEGQGLQPSGGERGKQITSKQEFKNTYKVERMEKAMEIIDTTRHKALGS